MRILTTIIVLLLFLGPISGAQDEDMLLEVWPWEKTSDMDVMLDDLTDLAAKQQRTFTEWTQGTILAARFYSRGTNDVPHVLNRFNDADQYEEAMLSGLYIALHGARNDHETVRAQLERNELKQTWLARNLGSSATLIQSMQGGQEWQPLTRVLPATDGCTDLALLCLESDDPLVRRFGLYAGYWFPTQTYWKTVNGLSRAEADTLTRGFAVYLLRLQATS